MSRLAPFLRSRTTRLIKSPKIYVSDAGLACHLASVRDLRSHIEEPLRGALFETFVAQNLAAVLGAHRPEAELCFWHVQGRYEVDFVIATGREAVAIEVKAAAPFADADLAGLRAFAAQAAQARVLILAYNGTEAVSLGNRLFAIPLGLLLS